MEHNTLGVWGLGTTGASIIRFLQRHNSTSICVMDKRDLTSDEQSYFTAHNIRYFHQLAIKDFFATIDYAVVSPGINLRLYPEYKDHCISEVDLFYTYWNKPSIVITGTLGKTTTTHALTSLLRSYGHKAEAGGNIGTTDMRCLLDLLTDQETIDIAVLELSSFQLEQSRNITADIAVVTNMYQNHLDYHGTMERYCLAKWQCILQQTSTQQAIIPLAMAPYAHSMQPGRALRIIASSVPEDAILQEHQIVYFFDSDHGIIRSRNGQKTLLVPQEQIPDISYRDNWIAIVAALDTYGIAINDLAKHITDLALPNHRLQRIATIDGIHFYNDSKSTIAEATIAAVNKIGSTASILLIGGVSKGVNRSQHIAALAQKVKYIICFGHEAPSLLDACYNAHIPARATENLDDAFAAAINHAVPGDHIIFSPAGASFDLFDNYSQRGERFVELVATYAQQKLSS